MLARRTKRTWMPKWLLPSPGMAAIRFVKGPQGLLRFKLTVQDDLDYMDENADKLSRKKMKTDALKRAFAINGQAILQ